MESIQEVIKKIQEKGIKSRLENVDNNIIKKLHNDLVRGMSPKKECAITIATAKQYEGLCWLKYRFTPSFQKKEEYQNVIGLHVMPYRIYERHLANIQEASTESPFIKQNTDYSNYDIKSGNIHICPNNEWQIVLIKKTSTQGPYWATDEEAHKNGYTLKIGNKFVQEKYYFPRITAGTEKDRPLDIFNENDDEDEDLISLIKSALDEVRKTH
ncbi:MAG: hypothetical protein ACI4DU_06095 [Lachnospiraceae bacterium]